jgi:hypothetical protein
MSSDTPGPADPQPEIEYLGDDRPPERRGRRTGLVVGATVAGVLAAAAGAFAVAQFMSSGPAPATVVPDDTMAYFSLDLDPDGGQKIEAVQTLRKFPAIRDELGLDGSEDLRRWLYEALTAEAPCPDIDFGDDVDPWLGNKVAVGARPGDDEPVLFFVVQVKDADLAKDGVAKIAECAGEDVPGTAFADDYMVVAETTEIADGIIADAEDGALADDDEFNRWIDAAGGSGIVEAYVSADAPEYLGKTMGFPTADDLGGLTDDEATLMSSDMSPNMGPDLAPGLGSNLGGTMPDLEAFKDFQGAAMVVRFDDEALEVEMAAGGLPGQVETGGDSGLGDLPASTALALGFGVPDDAVQRMFDSLSEMSGMTQAQVDEGLRQAERQTGLDLPDDVQTLLGDGLSIAVDSSVDFGAVVEGSDVDPADLPVGVRIVGDPDAITGVLDKLQAALGPFLGPLVVEEGDGVVAIGLDADYVATLAENGSLGEEDRFGAALEGLEGGAGGLYVDFDAGDWLTELAATDPDEKVQENVEPLDSLGITGGIDGDVAHAMLKLTTD